MRKSIVLLLLLLFTVAVITGCTTQTKTNYATGYPVNQYTPPPQGGAQGNNAPPPQPIQYGGGCGI